MPAELPDYVGQGERIAASGGTALRFALRRPLAAAARRDDRTWRVRLSADAQAPRPLYPLRLASPARLRLAPGEPPRLVVVRDPETGDQLTVWPLLQADLGQPRQSLVEIELLATAQGLAWRLRSDRVRPRVIGDAVEFDAPGGLALSERPGSEPSAAALTAESRRPAPPRLETTCLPDRPSHRDGHSCRGSGAHACRETGPSRERAGAAASAHTSAEARLTSAEPQRAQCSRGSGARERRAERARPAGGPPALEHRAGAPADPGAPLGLVGWDLRSATRRRNGAPLCCRRSRRRRRTSALRAVSSSRVTI